MTVEESGWRWRRTGDPVVPQQVGAPPAGELRDAGVTVTAYEAAVPRPSACPVCGRSAVPWRAVMTL